MARATSLFSSLEEAKCYLYCDGSSFSITDYPELYAILGTNILPDMRGKFLEGSDIAGKVLKAGLPNIMGYFGDFMDNWGTKNEGCFYMTRVPKRGYVALDSLGNSWTIHYDASRCSNIYGQSETVQPPAVTVRYYIRAK